MNSPLRPVDEVVNQLLEIVQPISETETRKLDQALNCYLAEDIASPRDVPPADNSAMDGYAICHKATPADEWLTVSDRIAAGQVGKTLEAGTAARIFTGAEIPRGADTVVIQENTESREGEVRLLSMPDVGANVRPQGQDIRNGDLILEKGRRLTPDCLALMASIGIPKVKTVRQLKVAIMSTGDELVEPGDEIKPGQIYNSNRYGLAGLLDEMGIEVIDLGIVPDDRATTEVTLLEAAEQADCILSSGGVSVGEEDHVKASVESLGRIDIWKLAIKPGKPLAYGEVKGTPFFGLPGNPVSTYVTFMVIAQPYLVALQGGADVNRPTYHGVADFEFEAGGRREYVRVKVDANNGVTSLSLFGNQGSGIMTSVVWADALAEIEVGQRVKPGDVLRFLPLK